MRRHEIAAGAAVLTAVVGGLAACGASRPAASNPPTVAATTAAATHPGTTPPPTATTAAAPTPSSPAPSNALPRLTSYVNPRYGFTVAHPAVLVPQPPPEDGDGLSWLAGGTREIAYGSNNVNDLTPAQDLAAAERGLQVTYTHVDGDRVVVSGLTEGGFVVSYEVDVVGTGSIDTLRWFYADAQKTTWDPLVTATAASFRPGDVAASH